MEMQLNTNFLCFGIYKVFRITFEDMALPCKDFEVKKPEEGISTPEPAVVHK